MAADIVGSLVRPQATVQGFDQVWEGIGPIVRDFARRCLRRLGVRRPDGDDDWAAGKPQGGEWYRTRPGGRVVKIMLASELDWNELSRGENGTSIVDRKVTKIERPDLRPILEAFPDTEQSQVRGSTGVATA